MSFECLQFCCLIHSLLWGAFSSIRGSGSERRGSRDEVYLQVGGGRGGYARAACCDKTDMNKPFLIKNIKQRKLKQIRNDPITTHITPKRTSTSIGPGDQSEEACPSVTIDRHQAESDTTEKNCRDTLTSTHRPKIPRNKQ